MHLHRNLCRSGGAPVACAPDRRRRRGYRVDDRPKGRCSVARVGRARRVTQRVARQQFVSRAANRRGHVDATEAVARRRVRIADQRVSRLRSGSRLRCRHSIPPSPCLAHGEMRSSTRESARRRTCPSVSAVATTARIRPLSSTSRAGFSWDARLRRARRSRRQHRIA